MNPIIKKSISILFIVTIIFALSASAGFAATASKITKEELKEVMTDDTVTILDVRRGKDWTSSEYKITGAVRADPQGFNMWSNRYSKDQTLVLYCA